MYCHTEVPNVHISFSEWWFGLINIHYIFQELLNFPLGINKLSLESTALNCFILFSECSSIFHLTPQRTGRSPHWGLRLLLVFTGNTGGGGEAWCAASVQAHLWGGWRSSGSTGPGPCRRSRCGGPGCGRCCSPGRFLRAHKGSSSRPPWHDRLASAAWGCGPTTGPEEEGKAAERWMRKEEETKWKIVVWGGQS